MKPLYLVHCPTPLCCASLENLGGIKFVEGIYLYSESDPSMDALRAGVANGDLDKCVVLPIFPLERPARIPSSLEEAEKLSELLGEVYGIAFRWPKYNKAYRDFHGLPEE